MQRSIHDSKTIERCCRFDEGANMQINYFCKNMILGVIEGVEFHCENKKMISLFKNFLI